MVIDISGLPRKSSRPTGCANFVVKPMVVGGASILINGAMQQERVCPNMNDCWQPIPTSGNYPYSPTIYLWTLLFIMALYDKIRNQTNVNFKFYVFEGDDYLISTSVSLTSGINGSTCHQLRGNWAVLKVVLRYCFTLEIGAIISSQDKLISVSVWRPLSVVKV